MNVSHDSEPECTNYPETSPVSCHSAIICFIFYFLFCVVILEEKMAICWCFVKTVPSYLIGGRVVVLPDDIDPVQEAADRTEEN